MASIGGGGEVNLLKLDDVDTGAVGNGKVLSYNASTGKLPVYNYSEMCV